MVDGVVFTLLMKMLLVAMTIAWRHPVFGSRYLDCGVVVDHWDWLAAEAAKGWKSQCAQYKYRHWKQIMCNLFRYCTTKYVSIAEDMFGSDIGALCSKSTRPKPSRVQHDRIETPQEIKTKQQLLVFCFDVMCANLLPMFYSHLHPWCCPQSDWSCWNQDQEKSVWCTWPYPPNLQ